MCAALVCAAIEKWGLAKCGRESFGGKMRGVPADRGIALPTSDRPLHLRSKIYAMSCTWANLLYKKYIKFKSQLTFIWGEGKKRSIKTVANRIIQRSQFPGWRGWVGEARCPLLKWATPNPPLNQSVLQTAEAHTKLLYIFSWWRNSCETRTQVKMLNFGAFVDQANRRNRMQDVPFAG